MKNIVVHDEFNQTDLKPTDLFREYLKLTEQDVRQILASSKTLKECACPGCGAGGGRTAFDRYGLKYLECPGCRTLYVSPRPEDSVLNDYYTKGKARTFWRDQLSKTTDRKRKEKIVKPRFHWILESIAEHLPAAQAWLDLNTTQDAYIDGMCQAKQFTKRILVNPYIHPDSLKGKTCVEVVASPWWKTSVKAEMDVVTLFEVADHTSDVSGLFAKVTAMLKPGGLCFITAILGSGFDIQTLWEKAENLYPPDRLNVFSTEGFQALFKKNNFEVLEFS
ncbi:MAG: methyltransferase domain-containing protein, partial [Candidatus Omnitrophota bacterium]|nr:methyltransferase domain-containing protein [Candidatus Omnitrophota bacterium]